MVFMDPEADLESQIMTRIVQLHEDSIPLSVGFCRGGYLQADSRKMVQLVQIFIRRHRSVICMIVCVVPVVRGRFCRQPVEIGTDNRASTILKGKFNE